MNYNDLPIDVQAIIINYLDIDTKRILGIYNKIKIDPLFTKKISTIPHVKNINSSCENNYIVSLYPYVIKHIITNNSTNPMVIYTIYNIEQVESYHYDDGVVEYLPRLLSID